jgi:hypothetical protein
MKKGHIAPFGIQSSVNDYFDTVVDNKIVSSNTLHGKFIQNVFGGNEAELKRQLKLELDKFLLYI